MSAISFCTATIDVRTLERLITVIQMTGETGRAEAENAAADNLQACTGLPAAGPPRLQLCTRALAQIADAAEQALPSGAAGWVGQAKSDVERARKAIRDSTDPPPQRNKTSDAIPTTGARAPQQPWTPVCDKSPRGTTAGQPITDPGGRP